MGVSPIDCEKIMENVSVLRQTLQLTAAGAASSMSNNSYSQQQSYDSSLVGGALIQDCIK